MSYQYFLTMPEGNPLAEFTLEDGVLMCESDQREVLNRLKFLMELKQYPQWQEIPWEGFLAYQARTTSNAYESVQLRIQDVLDVPNRAEDKVNPRR